MEKEEKTFLCGREREKEREAQNLLFFSLNNIYLLCCFFTWEYVCSCKEQTHSTFLVVNLIYIIINIGPTKKEPTGPLESVKSWLIFKVSFPVGLGQFANFRLPSIYHRPSLQQKKKKHGFDIISGLENI